MMDDIFSKISEVLQNPDALEQVKHLASGFTGGDSSESEGQSGAADGFSEEKIRSVMSSVNSQNKNIALLHAITPYMRRERADKINSAIKAIQALSLLNTLK